MQHKLLFNPRHGHLIIYAAVSASAWLQISGQGMASSLVRSALSNILTDSTF